MSKKTVKNGTVPVTQKPQRKNRSHHWPGGLLSVLLLLMAGFFCFQLYRLNILPAFLFAALAAVLFLLVILFFVLAYDSGRRLRFCLALLLFLLVGGVCAGGSYVAIRFTDTVKAMFRQDATETVIMQVYIRADDDVSDLASLKGETIGILQQIDRSATDEMLRKLLDVFGETPKVLEFASPVQLLSALSEGSVRAIIMNEHYLSLLEEDAAALSTVRTLHSQAVVIVATTAVPTSAVPISIILTEADDPSIENLTPDGSEPPPEQPLLPDDAVLAAEGNCFIAYISGIDSRQGLVSRSRSDVNILAVVNPDTRQILLVSTPRDCSVLTPVSGDQPDTLTYTGNYGIEISRETLEMLYNIRIDYWFRVDFSGFVKIIDVLGGIDINSDVAFTSGAYTFRKGINHVNGEAALAFARERQAFGGSDQFRGPHQMEVIKATLRKAASSQILSSWDQLLSAVSNCFEMTLPYDVIASLVRQQLVQSGEWNTVSYALEGDYDIRAIFSLYAPNYMFLPEEESIRTARRLIWDCLRGETLSAP